MHDSDAPKLTRREVLIAAGSFRLQAVAARG